MHEPMRYVRLPAQRCPVFGAYGFDVRRRMIVGPLHGSMPVQIDLPVADVMEV
jgi:hypothetical protein